MTANTIEERKQYINEIKASFQNPKHSNRYSDFEKEAEAPVKSNFFKVKLLFAVMIFGTFVYCDQSKIVIQGYSTKEVYHTLEETISLEKIIQTIENML